MSPARQGTPRPDLPPGPGNLFTIRLLAERLGITVATMRQYAHANPRPAWLPEPQRLGTQLVWPAETLEGIEEARRSPGRPRKGAESESAGQSGYSSAE